MRGRGASISRRGAMRLLGATPLAAGVALSPAGVALVAAAGRPRSGARAALSAPREALLDRAAGRVVRPRHPRGAAAELLPGLRRRAPPRREREGRGGPARHGGGLSSRRRGTGDPAVPRDGGHARPRDLPAQDGECPLLGPAAARAPGRGVTALPAGAGLLGAERVRRARRAEGALVPRQLPRDRSLGPGGDEPGRGRPRSREVPAENDPLEPPVAPRADQPSRGVRPLVARGRVRHGAGSHHHRGAGAPQPALLPPGERVGRLLGRRRRRRARHEGADLVSAAVLLVLVVRQGPRLLPRGPARAPRRPRLSLAEAPAAGDPDRRGLLPFAGRLAHAGRGVERGRAAGGLRPHPLARLRGRHLGGALHGGEPQPALPRAPGVGHPRPRGPAGPGVAELRARERAHRPGALRPRRQPPGGPRAPSDDLPLPAPVGRHRLQDRLPRLGPQGHRAGGPARPDPHARSRPSAPCCR